MKKISRRSFLTATAISTVAALSGCVATTSTSSSTPSSSTTAPDGAASSSSNEKQKVKAVLLGPAKEEDYYYEQMDLFLAENPDIDCEVVFTPNDNASYSTAVQLMFSSDEAPDIFRVSGSLPTSMLSSYAKGWLAPIDDYLSEETKATFPDGAFGPSGGLMFDGHIYALPFIAVEYPAFRPMIYNMGLLKEYGFDTIPQSWAELKSMCLSIKEQSGGKVYGFGAAGADSGAYLFSSMGETIRTTGVDLATTEGNFLYDATTGYSFASNEGTLAVVDFIQELNDEGLMIPGWESSEGSTLEQYMATGNVAMVAANSYWITDIMNINPDLELEVGAPLRRTPEDNGYRYIYSVCDPYYGMSSFCQYPEATYRVMEFLSSLEFQKGFYNVTGRVTVGFREYEEGTMSALMEKNMENASNYLHVAPNPADKAPAVTTLLSNILANAPTPTLAERYLLSIVGGESFVELANAYDEAMDIVVDEQIKKLQDEGIEITREDLIFPADWDLDVNYV